jgi:[ribosomal protein S18]-alanine N-acetyltransferase
VTPVALRPLDNALLPAAAALHRICFPEDPWDAAGLAGILSMPGGFGALALDDGAALGFVLGYVVEDSAELATIGVAPSARRRGMAQLLLRHAVEVARQAGAARLFLEVAIDNEAALALYACCGFKEVGRRPRYYRRPEGALDAIALALDLINAGWPETPL